MSCVKSAAVSWPTTLEATQLPSHPEAKRRTILIRYWENHAQHLPSAEQAKYALAMWSDHFSEAAVSELTPQRQKSFVEALRAKGLRPSYISRVLSVGRAAIRFAWKQGELLTVPFIIDVHRD